MEKKYIIGGLAIVGALALFAYLKPTTAKKNSEGFFGANGKTNFAKANKPCTRCKRPNGTYYTPTGVETGQCFNYATCV
jgi:hypothetical protein